MAYITREDGERFVVPSYRDVLSGKNKGQLKKDILLLSQSYGEYITMQKKNALQYEIAFSPDAGYLLGETIWQYFKAPDDLIYCETVPGSTDVILTIVKDGSVYLDGSFPYENIQEELVVFLTQETHFEIYTYGEVPISDSPKEGKFSFDPKSVKSYTALDKPIFPLLPLLPNYKLQLVDQVLKQHGIGTFPIIPAIIVVVGIGVAWMIYSSLQAPEQKQVVTTVAQNPYQEYITQMYAPLAEDEIDQFNKELKALLVIPAWQMNSIDETNGTLTAMVSSNGGNIEGLYVWAKNNGFVCSLTSSGYQLTATLDLTKIDRSNTITNLEEVLANFMDKMGIVNPGNTVTIADMKDNHVFKVAKVNVNLDQFAPLYIGLVAKQFKGLPLIVQDIKGTMNNGIFTGTISLTALGN